MLFVLPVVLHAQSPAPPDLSGTWKLNREKSKLPKRSKTQSQTIVIICSGPVVQMRNTINGQESTQTYTADGIERKVRETQNGDVLAKAQWSGSVLIIEKTARLKQSSEPSLSGSEAIHVKERWKLSGDGRVLTVEVDNAEQTIVFDKLPTSLQ